MSEISILNEANQAFQKDDYKKAIELYQNYGKKSPGHHERIKINLHLAKSRLEKNKVHAVQDKKIATGHEKIIVYTVNVGNYESVKEPLFIDPTVEYVLFTDNKDLKSDHWKIIYLNEKLSDPRRTSRLAKILAHKYLPEHDVSVYIDSSLEIKTPDVRKMVSECMEGQDIALYKHYKRDCVYDEINFVMNSTDRIVTNKELCKQAIKKYEAINYPKNNGLFENAFIFRRNTNKVKQLNELWWKEYQAGTERDQFVLMYALNQTGIKPNPIEIGKGFRENQFVNFIKHSYRSSEELKNSLSMILPDESKGKNLAIIHVYHDDLINQITLQAKRLQGFCDLVFTVTKGSKHIDFLKKDFPEARTFEFENKGQDVIPFLKVVKNIGINYELICKVHTKKGDKQLAHLWREELYDTVSKSEEYIKQVISSFKKDKSLGILGSTLFYVPLKKYAFSNTENIMALLEPLNAKYDDNVGFFAGTIFWARSDVAIKTASILKEERIDVTKDYVRDGTDAHAFERLFGIVNHHLNYNVGHASTGLEVDIINVKPSNYFSSFVMENSSITSSLDSLKKIKEKIKIIKKSNIFDEFFYKEKYLDRMSFSPIFHFAYQGIDENLSPNAYFDPEWYFRVNRDLKKRNINPFLHYVSHGDKEGRYANPIFNPKLYREKYMGSEDKGLALAHYIIYGDKINLKPGKYFNPEYISNKYMNDQCDFQLTGKFYMDKLLPLELPFWNEDLFNFKLPNKIHIEDIQPFSYRHYHYSLYKSENYVPSNRGVTVITPTGDRVEAFRKCLLWVLTQTIKPDQWIIVDDGETPLKDLLPLPEWVTYVRRKRLDSDPKHTLTANLKAAIPLVENDNVFIMEDDDWYHQNYIEYLLKYLGQDSNEMVGLNVIRYYHIQAKQSKSGEPKKHTALAQTACKRVALGKLLELCDSDNHEIRNNGVVDRFWWHQFEGKQHLIKGHPVLHCGFKGVPGRTGLAEGHKFDDKDYIKDTHDFKKLISYIGKDLIHYNDWLYRKNLDCIYTSVSGGYDSNKPILYLDNSKDHFFVSDIPPSYSGWIWIPTEVNYECNNLNAKRAKVLNHIYFGFYEKSLFIDCNVFIKSSLEKYFDVLNKEDSLIAQFRHPERDEPIEELEACRKAKLDSIEAFDKAENLLANRVFKNPLFECNFILRKSERIVNFAMYEWYLNILNVSKRDQLTHVHSIEKSGLKIMQVSDKGSNIRNMSELFYVKHGDIELLDCIDGMEIK